ncbi:MULTISPECIES: tlde1 domain-containing protein [Paraburkholderia]|uniref:DUF2778 domain-containing protein n=1 Tax=Paraburkholderia podalyriae TaxID=1938811 RepID=A0ABR7PVI8_9BURK|nr:tlde1 domain-containing protein [Paraburkholderia podalyriae]MBC8750302.1 DUF2778 domain-containing protein [Paraburkholderia podalyriae]
MAWIYKQTSGEMYHNGVLMEKKGYSGKGEGKNKRSKQYVRDKGPIPVGRYEITAPFDHTHTERWRRWFGQSDRVYKWKRRGHQAANLIAGSVAKYASSGV